MTILFDPDRYTNPLLPDYGVPDNQPGPYYVTAARGRAQWLLVVGPYAEHADAMAWVALARAKAHELDPAGSAFMSFGTGRLLEGEPKAGLLNHHLGLVPTLLPRGTLPPVRYRLGRATFFQDPDDPLMRGWAWQGVRYCIPGRGPMPPGGIRLGEGLLLHMDSGEIHAEVTA